MSRWGQFRVRPLHLVFGVLAAACAVINATLAETGPLLAGWTALGVAGAVWVGFVSWALWTRRPDNQDRRS